MEFYIQPREFILKSQLLAVKFPLPRRKNLTNQRTLNSFFLTPEAANTDDTLQAVDTGNQDSNPPENCDNDTATLPAKKPREEMVNTEATSSTTASQLPSKEQDAISLEKGREEISTILTIFCLRSSNCTTISYI